MPIFPTIDQFNNEKKFFSLFLVILGADSIAEDANEEATLAKSNFSADETLCWDTLSGIASKVKDAKAKGKPATELKDLVYQTRSELKKLEKLTADENRRNAVGILRFLNLMLCQIADDGKLSYINFDYYYQTKNSVLSALIAKEKSVKSKIILTVFFIEKFL